MPRLSFLAIVALIGAAALSAQLTERSATGQESTPPAEPEVVIVDTMPDYLAVEVVEEFATAPALMELIRVTLEPGAVHTLPGQRGAAPLVLVEAGTLTAQTDAPVTITRGGPGGEAEEITAGSELTATGSDYFAGTVEAHNDGREPLSLLVFVIEPVSDDTPIATEADLLAGVTAEIVAADVTEAVPEPPVLLELIRFTFAPGGYVELPDTSPATALLVVESGAMTVEMTAPAVVHRTLPGAADPVRDEVAAGTEFTVDAGQHMIGEPYAAVDARNDGAEPLSVFMAVMQPAIPPAE